MGFICHIFLYIPEKTLPKNQLFDLLLIYGDVGLEIFENFQIVIALIRG